LTDKVVKLRNKRPRPEWSAPDSVMIHIRIPSALHQQLVDEAEENYGSLQGQVLWRLTRRGDA
jgi:hypothetical protein